LGRITSRTDPLKQTTSYTYDSRNRVGSVTLPLGSAQYSYDAAGNLTSLKYSDGTNLTYTFDADNQLTAATGVTLSRDSDGRITNSNGLTITRDPAGRVVSVTYAAGKTVNYTYNNRGLLSQVTDWIGGNTTFTYDNAEELTTTTFANGVTEARTYDADGRVLTIAATNSGKTLSSTTLTRDALGRVTGAARSAANIPTEATGTLALEYNAASEVVSDTYDALGRLTQDSQRSYTWDLASRLASYAGSNGSASFTYDAFGQRLSRTSSGTTQNYIWDYAFPLPVLSTVQSGGADQTYYIWLPDGTLLNSISASSGTRRFYHFDESGSVVLLTDSTGAVTDTYAVSIYGDTVTQTGSTANPFTFQGKYGIMSEGSLYYMRARYYDSGATRFISRDPISLLNPREIDPYHFAAADPLEHGDPTGRLDTGFALVFLTAFGVLSPDEVSDLIQGTFRTPTPLSAGEELLGSATAATTPAASGATAVSLLKTVSDDAVFTPPEQAPGFETEDGRTDQQIEDDLLFAADAGAGGAANTTCSAQACSPGTRKPGTAVTTQNLIAPVAAAASTAVSAAATAPRTYVAPTEAQIAAESIANALYGFLGNATPEGTWSIPLIPIPDAPDVPILGTKLHQYPTIQ
jgi:RHS repeat-associated protein